MFRKKLWRSYNILKENCTEDSATWSFLGMEEVLRANGITFSLNTLDIALLMESMGYISVNRYDSTIFVKGVLPCDEPATP